MQSSCRPKYWNSDRIMTFIIGLAVVVGLIWLIRYLSHVLLPFFVACFVAYLLQPLVAFNQRITRTKGRVLASLLTVLDVTAVIGVLIYLFVPSVISEVDTLGAILHDVSTGKRPMSPIYGSIIELIDRYFDPDNIRRYLTGARIEEIISKGSSLIEESLDIILETLGWLLTLIYIIFILIDYPQISRGFKLIIPHKYRRQLMPVARDVADNMNRFFRGQGLVALCATVFYCVGFSIVGLPLAIPMGLLVGVLYMIPYFQYVTVIPVAAICLVYSMGGDADFWPLLGKCGLVYVCSQCVCDYIITPHVMGREMGLNPAIILLSLSVWGSLLGIIGMIIALPVTALIMTYYDRYISEPTPRAPEKGSDGAEETGRGTP